MARLLLPPGAAVLRVDSREVAQPPKDTGTLLGTIQRDPITYYKCAAAAAACHLLLPAWRAAAACCAASLLLPRCLLSPLHGGRSLPSTAAPRPAPTPACCPCAPPGPPRSYDVRLPDGTRVALMAAAQLGRLYVLAATAPDAEWAEVGPALREAALSFRLRYPS